MENTLYATSLRESFATYHPSFDELFERFWSNFGSLSRPKAEHLESLTVELPISPRDALMGGRVRVLVPAHCRCPVCEGRGAVNGYECWQCEGHGGITADFPIEVRYPAGIANEYSALVPLSSLGIENFYLTVRFRVSGAEQLL